MYSQVTLAQGCLQGSQLKNTSFILIVQIVKENNNSRTRRKLKRQNLGFIVPGRNAQGGHWSLEGVIDDLTFDRRVFYLEVWTQEWKRTLSVHIDLNSKLVKEIMAFYLFFGGNTSQNFCFPQNLPLFSQFNMPSSIYSMENFQQHPSLAYHPIFPEQKNTPEVPTVAPEEVNRSSSQPMKNRRKREKNLERQLVSAKKNSQSNIINHFFTYFTAREASETLVKRAILSLGKEIKDIGKMISLTYHAIKIVNLKRGRKYINKAILWNCFSEENLAESIGKLQNSEGLTPNHFSSLLRKCLCFFMHEVSLTSILTSKRITKHSKEIHLNKRRKIIRFLHSLTSQQ